MMSKMNTRTSLLAALLLLLAAPAALSRQPAEDPWLWMEEQKFNGTDTVGDDAFGFSLALDGDTALIGADRESVSGIVPGVVYVKVRSGPNWLAQARLVASDPVNEVHFGYSVALQGDTALIGAPRDADGGERTGSVYVFTRSAGVWSQVAKLKAPDGTAGDWFGRSVALGGNVALIGAPYDDGSTGTFYSGSAYVFTGSGASWTFLQKLEEAGPDEWHRFGGAVALSGTTALIAAEAAWGIGDHTGAAYVFTKSGGAWHEQAKLFASDGSFNHRFGWSIALDGDRALIGQLENHTPHGPGSAYLFERSGTSWSQVQKLVPSDGDGGDQFGHAVALEGDTAMVGAANKFGGGGPDGGAYVFHRQGASWNEMEKLDVTTDQVFGFSLVIDGHRALIGDPYDLPGRTYVYERPPASGFRYCFGDPGVDTPCPCNKDKAGLLT